MSTISVSIRDVEEIRRSAAEAARTIAVPHSEILRYLNPPADTAFALEYAYHLLGDVRGKTVVDLGCGSGENIPPLLMRGASVIGIDLSPDLVSLANRRLAADPRLDDAAWDRVRLSVGAAYDTGLPSESVDVIFCVALVHHLEIEPAREEMLRILKPGGCVIVKEPIRFSRVYAWLRGLLPAQAEVSEFEHPLTARELVSLTAWFRVEGARYFRLPFVPLVERFFPSQHVAALRRSDQILREWPSLRKYATEFCGRLVKEKP